MDNANASAFPLEEGPYTKIGLTKREHFAAMAMQGMLSDESEDCGGVWKPEDCAKRACEFADALLRALSAPPANEGRG